MVVTEAQFKDWTRPRLMLFLSADVENSTKLKQTADSHWLELLAVFFAEFPRNFQAARESIARQRKFPAPTRVPPWKTLGDELIFAIEVTAASQPECEVMAFRQTLETWNHESVKGTRLKGTGWLAGFPVANKLLPNPSSQEKDFVGPSMDTGFRLGKTATCRRFVLSVELAWWLLTHKSGKRSHSPLNFHGCENHKGLAEETGYPFIWIAVQTSPYQALEDRLLGRSGAKAPDSLRLLSEAFILEFGVPRRLPFIWTEERHDEGFAEELSRAIDILRPILLIDQDAGPETSPERQEAEAKSLLRELPAPHPNS